jgi:hypothetical protein
MPAQMCPGCDFCRGDLAMKHVVWVPDDDALAGQLSIYDALDELLADETGHGDRGPRSVPRRPGGRPDGRRAHRPGRS